MAQTATVNLKALGSGARGTEARVGKPRSAPEPTGPPVPRSPSGFRRTALAGALRIVAALLVLAAWWLIVTPPALAQAAPTHIYWTNPAAGTIGRANIADPSDANASFITGASNPTGIAVDDSHVYWANERSAGTIGRASIADPSDANPSFIAAPGVSPVAVGPGADPPVEQPPSPPPPSPGSPVEQPPPPPPAATTALNVRLQGVPARIRLNRLRRQGVTVRLRSSKPASYEVALLASVRGATISRFELELASASLRRGADERTVRLRPVRRLLRRTAARFRLRLRVRATDAAGNQHTVHRTIQVRR